MGMTEKMATRQAYGQVLLELGDKYSNLVVLDGDLSKSTMTYEFGQENPKRFFNMGIAEQNLYGTAAGMALSGKIVCASTFAMFAAGRAFEIIRNSIGYTNANVKICATHSGITVGEDGGSHQTFEDIALMRTIPGMTVVNPCDGYSTKELMRQVCSIDGPCYVRLGRFAVPFVYKDGDGVTIGKGNQIKDGGDLTIIATGIMVNEALIAYEELKDQGIESRIIDMHTIKPIDKDIIVRAAKETGKIITAEEHGIIGGLGSAVAEVVVKEHPVKMAFVGQLDTFGESGKPAELMKKYHMTAADIVEAATNILKA
jgi:transketolase